MLLKEIYLDLNQKKNAFSAFMKTNFMTLTGRLETAAHSACHVNNLVMIKQLVMFL